MAKMIGAHPRRLTPGGFTTRRTPKPTLKQFTSALRDRAAALLARPIYQAAMRQTTTTTQS